MTYGELPRLARGNAQPFVPADCPAAAELERSSPALRAALERAYKREFIAHAARGRTRNESHCPSGRCLSARYVNGIAR